MKILYNKDKWLNEWKKPKYEIIRKRILSSFEDLQFIDEGHKYFINGKELLSVSVITHQFVPPFNEEIMARETYERNFENKKSKYYHMSINEIKENWKNISEIACIHGTERHEFGESCFYYMTGQYDKILPEFKDRLLEDGGFLAKLPKEEAVVNFYNDIPKNFIPIFAETKVYNEDLGYAGTFDILFYYDNDKNENNSGLIIFDFKTNKDLFKNFNKETMLAPFNELLAMPLSSYKLQLAAYQLCLEKIGLNVIARRIIWLKPNSTYEKINLENCSRALKNALNNLK